MRNITPLDQKQNLFTSEIKAVEPIVFTQRKVIYSLLGLSTVTLLTPIILRMPKVLDNIFLGTSFVAAISSTLCIKGRKEQEEIYTVLNKGRRQALEAKLAYAKTLDDVELEIMATQKLVNRLQALSPREAVYFGALNNVLPLLELPGGNQTTVDVSATSESWVNESIPPGSVTIAQELEDKLIQASIDWILDVVKSICEPDENKRRYSHLMFNGGSQSGKSYLFSKILELIIKRLASKGQQVTICLIDPKYPKTRWTIKPSFKGYGNVLKGMQTAYAEFLRRKKLCVEAEEAGLDQPIFSRFILICDEWDNCVNKKGYGEEISKEEAEEISNIGKIFMKESAAYDMMIVFIGQSPLNDATSYTRSDLNSVCRFVLSNEALKYIQDSSFPHKRMADDLEDLYYAYEELDLRVVLICPTKGLPTMQPIPDLVIEKIDDSVVTNVNEKETVQQTTNTQKTKQKTKQDEPKEDALDIPEYIKLVLNFADLVKDKNGQVYTDYYKQLKLYKIAIEKQLNRQLTKDELLAAFYVLTGKILHDSGYQSLLDILNTEDNV